MNAPLLPRVPYNERGPDSDLPLGGSLRYLAAVQACVAGTPPETAAMMVEELVTSIFEVLLANPLVVGPVASDLGVAYSLHIQVGHPLTDQQALRLGVQKGTIVDADVVIKINAAIRLEVWDVFTRPHGIAAGRELELVAA